MSIPERRFTPRGPERLSFSGLRGIQGLSSSMIIECDDPSLFKGELCSLVFDDMAVAWLQHTPVRRTRSVTHRERSVSGITVLIVNRGPFLVAQGEVLVRAEEGDVVVLPSEAQYALAAPNGTDLISVTLVPTGLDLIQGLALDRRTRLLPQTPVTVAAVGLLRAMMLAPPRPGTREGASLHRSLGELLTGMLRNEPESRSGRRAGVRGAELVERALECIRDRSSDGRLNVALVATTVGTSTRNLQRLFAARGTTVNAAIRDERVRTALPFIVDEDFTARALPDIAAQCGFLTVTRLRRSFQSVFSMSIAEYRASELSE